MKRCKSTAPVHTELRCELERGHNKRNPRSLHKSGDIVWDNAGGHMHRPGGTLMDLIRTHAAKNIGIFPPEFAEEKLGHEPTFVAFDELAGRSTSAAHELAEWWRATSEAEIEQTVEKAIEYGATDLIDIGMMLARTMRREVDEEEAAELGVFFYLIGKIARWQSAIERGDRPSDDCLLDIGVYVRMAQRIRHSGGWPGTDTPLADTPRA